ncbi:type I-U CRISPR-associated protein Csb2 [Actinomyces trachealis]|uniref:type I-G CRISPR-associated protein Csb2 n=1 Tax=Actinomyces trachealis TaxID=2763540 RepID=UPI001892D033|nr:type I-U CRISPR-associated protein Csb2 [Actinomyces trachealis]
MDGFTVEARFPLGEFNAHGADGQAEWPPSPARLLAALLSTAYSLGCGVEAVRALYELPAPSLSCPPRGARDTGYGRWVPVNNALKFAANGTPSGIVDAKHRFGDKAVKPPERGSLLGRRDDDVVRWVFPGTEQGQGPDPDVLRMVARQVEYLGRPTSPVLLDVHAGCREAPASNDRWEPDPLGPWHLQVGTPGLLQWLDEREEARRRSRFTGSHPALPYRPTARYRLIGDQAQQATPPDSQHLLDGAALYRMQPSQGASVEAADLGIVLDQLASALGEAEWMLPVLGQEGRGRLERQVLRAVLVRGAQPAREIPLAVRAGVTQVIACEPRVMTSLPRLIRAMTAVSSTWTSLVPVRRDPGQLREELEALAARHQVRLVDAGLHRHACAEVGVTAGCDSGARHVTLRFDAGVAGPVVLGGVMMSPMGASGLAVNPKRRSAPRNR